MLHNKLHSQRGFNVIIFLYEIGMQGAGKTTQLVRLKARAKPSQGQMGYRVRGRPPKFVSNTGSAEGGALERRAEHHFDPLPLQHVCRRLLE